MGSNQATIKYIWLTEIWKQAWNQLLGEFHQLRIGTVRPTAIQKISAIRIFKVRPPTSADYNQQDNRDM